MQGIMYRLSALGVFTAVAWLTSCSSSGGIGSSAGSDLDFREVRDPFLNDFNLLSYNNYQYGLGFMNSLCSSESLVGYERGFQLAFSLKRDQLNSLQLDTSGQEYRRLAQQLEGYAVQWEILNQDLKTACRTHAICMMAEMDAQEDGEPRTNTSTTPNSVTTVTVDESAKVPPQVCENAKGDYDRRVQEARDFVVRITEIEVQGQ